MSKKTRNFLYGETRNHVTPNHGEKHKQRGVMMAKMSCDSCKVTPWVVLIAGILYLGVDLGWGWTSFWSGINWWTFVLLLWGLKGVLKNWK